MNRELIESYAAGADVLGKSIQGLDRADLLAFPVPGTWNIQQIVLHMMDSDLIASDRMKRVAAEDHPTLIGYNETAFAKTLAYDHVPAQEACEVFRLNRRITAELMRRLPDPAFAKSGFHNERGEVTLERNCSTTYTQPPRPPSRVPPRETQAAWQTALSRDAWNQLRARSPAQMASFGRIQASSESNRGSARSSPETILRGPPSLDLRRTGDMAAVEATRADRF